MPLDPLATVSDLQSRLPQTLSPEDQDRAEVLLRDASARVRREAGGQEISARESTARLAVCCGLVTLPQYPVTAVGSVQTVDGDDVDVTWDGSLLTVYAAGGTYVDVTYTHGYDPVPDDIVALVCQIAGRALSTPPTSSGVTQETLGAYTYGIGSAAASGPLGMLDEEKATARAYRRPTRPVSVLGYPVASGIHVL